MWKIVLSHNNFANLRIGQSDFRHQFVELKAMS